MGRHPSSDYLAELARFLSDIRGKDYSEAHSLPGGFYTDTEWLAKEQSALFAQHWICVGRVEEVEKAGDYIAFDLCGEPILVMHGIDGELRALSNVCRHRGTVIMQGEGNAEQLLCPYHHWRYDTLGKLVNAPSIQHAPHFHSAECRLPSFHLEVWQGFLFVSIADEPSPLYAQLSSIEKLIAPYHLEQMHLQYLANEVWEVNWKVLLENFMEGYHLSPLHRKTLHKVNPSHLCKHLVPGDLHFGYEVGFNSRVPDDSVGHPDLTPEQLNKCIMFAVPPGLTVGIGSDYSSFLCIRPQATESVAVKMGLIFHGESWKQSEIDDAVTLFKETMAEDKQVLLRVQQGMHSRFHQPGPLAPPDLEGTIWDFYQYLARSV